MVCRSTPGNSAITTMARLSSNLHDVQVLSLFHETRSEAPRETAAPSDVERDNFLHEAVIAARVNHGDLSPRRLTDLTNRLHEADSVPVDGRTYYAWRNIEQRAIYARQAMESHFRAIAANHSATPEQVEAAFNEMMHRDHRVNGEVPQAPENVSFATSSLPRDRGTRYALAMLHTGGPQITRSESQMAHVYASIHQQSERLAAEAANQPANRCPDCGEFADQSHTCTTSRERTRGAFSSSAEVEGEGEGHVDLSRDPAYQRALQSIRRVPDGTDWVSERGRVFPTRREAMEEALRYERHQDRASETEAAQQLAEHVRDNADPAYFRALQTIRRVPGGSDWENTRGMVFANRALAMEDALHYERHQDRASRSPQRCPECGEFASEDHFCESPLQEWERELLLGFFPDATSTTDDTAPTPTVEPSPDTSDTAEPVRRRNPLRTYVVDGRDVSVRMMNVSSMRAIDPDTPETMDGIEVRYATNADGTPTTATVSGSVTVLNTGLRRTRTRDRYNVNPTDDRSLRCTCPAYAANYDCEHVRQAVEDVASLINQRDATAVAPAVAMNTVAADLRDEFDASLAASQAAREGFDATTDVSYEANMASFQTAWDEAKAHLENDHRLPYMYENATNGLGARDGGRSIGIEIEVDFPDDMDYTSKNAVAREIYEAGLSDSPDVRPWHWRARQVDARGRAMGGGYTDNPNMWSVEFDRSVDDVGGQRGCEIVSPILYDTPETWQNLKRICDIVERHGGRVTPRTGLHINIGAADFDHTVGNHNRLIGIANAYEDVIVRAAHNPQSGPNHRGRDYCRPMSMPEEGFNSIRQAQRSIDPQNYEGSSHRAMINLDHVPAEGAPVQSSTRVEVRIFDGSIDPGRIQANVKLSLGMVNAAVRGVEVPRDQERAGTHRATNTGSNGRMRRLRGEDWERDTASFRRLADTIFSREEDKKQLTYAFAASRWQRR